MRKGIILIVIIIVLSLMLTSCLVRIEYDNSEFESLEEISLTLQETEDIGSRRTLYHDVTAISDGFLAWGVAVDSSLYQSEILFSAGSHSDMAVLTKYNENGILVWERFFLDSEDMIRFSAVLEVSDGFIFRAYSGKDVNDIRTMLIKLDKDGEYIWAKTPDLTPIFADNEGGFFAIGCDNREIRKRPSSAYLYKKIFMAQFDKNGDLVSKKMLGDRYIIDGNNHVIRSGLGIFHSEAGFYLFGSSFSNKPTLNQAYAFQSTPTYNWLTYYNKKAELIWEKPSLGYNPFAISEDGISLLYANSIKKYDFDNNLLWEVSNDYEEEKIYFMEGIEIDDHIFAFGNTDRSGNFFIRGYDAEGELFFDTGVLSLATYLQDRYTNKKIMRTKDGFAVYIRPNLRSMSEDDNALIIYNWETQTYLITYF